MKRMPVAIFAGIAVLSLLSSCGPVYRTVYTFRPPQTPHGQTCIMQCDYIKIQCRINEDFRLRNCEDESRIAELEYQQCMSMQYNRCWDRSRYCGTPDYRHCDEDYRICYQTCGGLVFSREVCVSGCEQQR